MKIKTKIIFGAVLGTLVTVGVMGGLVSKIAGTEADKTFVDIETKALISINRAKKEQVETYFNTIRSQLSTYSKNKMIVEAMGDFDSAFRTFGIDTSEGAERQIDTSETAAGSLTSNASGRLNPKGTFTGLNDYYNGPFAQRFRELNNGADPEVQSRFDGLSLRAKTLQDLYIGQNPHPIGAKDELVAAPDQSLYTKLHERFHPVIRDFQQQFGYYDIFLVNYQGDIVYSVFKELDYATNLITGPYANTAIADAFKAAEAIDVKEGEVTITDFAPYYPSYNGAASFFASPIFDGERKIGVLIMQAPVDRLNSLMTSNNQWKNVGLGESGETYIVGSDNLLRNDSRFLIEDKANYLAAIKDDPNVRDIEAKNTSVGLQYAKSPGIEAALNGQTGFDIFPDYRGVNVFSSYAPLDIPGLNWALMAEIDEAEVLKPAEVMNTKIAKNAAIIALGSLLFVGLGAFFLVRSISKPLNKLGTTIRNVANGDLTARSKLNSKDELEELGNTFDDLLDDRLTTLEEASSQNKQLNESVVGLMNATSQLADRDLTIEVPVAEDVTGTVSDALNMMVEETADVLIEITNISKQVEDSVNMVQSQTVNLKGAADSEKEIVQNTIEQLHKVSDSINNIGGLVQTVSTLASNVQTSSTTTADTVNKNIDGMNQIKETVSETEKRIKRLGERSEEIGNIVNIINTLSERTHVLALNASMQAASAGEAGKGFAVVADEVQRLSESSRESTLEISALVDSIQLETSEAISTMNATISRVVEGAELAGEAGLQMTKTQSDATQLAEAIKRISAESQSQTLANSQMMKQANTVMESTEKTSQALDQQSVQTSNLVAYAGKLRSEVGTFKLPVQ